MKIEKLSYFFNAKARIVYSSKWKSEVAHTHNTLNRKCVRYSHYTYVIFRLKSEVTGGGLYLNPLKLKSLTKLRLGLLRIEGETTVRAI